MPTAEHLERRTGGDDVTNTAPSKLITGNNPPRIMKITIYDWNTKLPGAGLFLRHGERGAEQEQS